MQGKTIAADLIGLRHLARVEDRALLGIRCDLTKQFLEQLPQFLKIDFIRVYNVDGSVAYRQAARRMEAEAEGSSGRRGGYSLKSMR